MLETNKWTKREAAAIAAVLVIYCILAAAAPSGFWIIDEGNKYIWADNLAESGSMILPGRAGGISPGHGAFREPFSVSAGENSAQMTVFSPLFIVLTAPLVKLGGLKLALLIPIISSILLLLAVKKLAESLELRFDWRLLLITGLTGPLVFYSLTLWEHSLALFLGIWAVALARSDKNGILGRFGPGFILAIAIFIRPEMAYFALAAWIFLMKNRVNVIIGGVAGLVLMLWVNRLLAGSFLPLQIVSNFGFRWENLTIGGWLVSRADAVYALLIQSSRLWYLSAIAAAAAVIYLVFPGAVKLLFPAAMTAVIIAAWPDAQPFFHTATKGGLLFAAPLFFIAFFVKTENPELEKIRKAVLLTVILTVLTTPVFRGIHFGPRLLLPVIPLLAVMLSVYLQKTLESKNKLKIYALTGVIFAQLLVTVWGIDLLFDKRAVNAARREQILAKSENSIVTLRWWLQQEIPELYFQRDLYLADTVLDFKLMLIDFYREGVRYFTLLIPEDGKSPLLDFVNSTPPKQIGAFAVETGHPNMNLAGLNYAIGFDVKGAAELADELGVYFGQIGRLDKSEKYLRYAASWDSQAAKYHYNLGYCLGKKGGPRGALEEFEKAHQLDPGDELIARMTRELREQLKVVEIE